jgi:hypothetical protein
VAEDVPVAIPDKQVGSDEEAAVAVEEPPDGDVRDEDSAPRGARDGGDRVRTAAGALMITC